MKRFVRVAVWSLVAIAGITGIGVSYFLLKYPQVDPPLSLSIERSPERIARGKYLATHVTGCIDCHSTRDWKYFSGPVIPGTEGKGGFLFDESIGIPGKIYAKNITPAGIGTMSDGELLRALTSGVDRNGKVLFPLMPYLNFNKMAEEDLYSIIAYTRTLEPIENQIPESHIEFPVNFLIRTLPEEHQPCPEPERNNQHKYGNYLVNAASCTDCHTPQKDGKPIEGMEFAGGAEYRASFGIIRSANITPDEETGIGLWSKEIFTARFKNFASPKSTSINPDSMKYNTVMPWTLYAGMTEEDLEAIYTHLHTVNSVKHKVDRFTPISTQ